MTVVNDLTEDMDGARYMGVFDRLLNHLEGIYHPITRTSRANLDHFHRYIPLLSQLPQECAHVKRTLKILPVQIITHAFARVNKRAVLQISKRAVPYCSCTASRESLFRTRHPGEQGQAIREAKRLSCFFKATLLLILQEEEAKQRLLVQELKTALHRYLEPLLG